MKGCKRVIHRGTCKDYMKGYYYRVFHLIAKCIDMEIKRDWMGRFAKGWSWQKKVCFVAMVACLALIIGGKLWEVITYEIRYVAAPFAYASEIKFVTEEDKILQKIADCESGNGKEGSGRQHLDNGRVVLNVNKDGSADVGKWQINLRYHGAALARMKLDVINSEEDNEEFARHLYRLNGTKDWGASKHCWNQ
jgi:hypothetical protein